MSGSLLVPIGFLPAIALVSSSTMIVSSLNPSTFSQGITLTATVTPSTATGTVQFIDVSTSPAAVLSTGTISGGIASFSTSSLSIGSHSIVANYEGDTNTAASTSTALVQIINNVSSVTITSSQNPTTSGQSVTFTATVSPSTATGTIQFLANGSSLGSPVTLSAGQAAFTTTSLATGRDNITASYSGDSVFGSNRGIIFQTVNKIATSETLSSSLNPAIAGQSVTFTANVSPSSATGLVTFMDGTTLLGSGTISSGVATFTTSSLSGGVHDLTAIYLGDQNHADSTSVVLVQTINQATASSTTTVLSSNATSIISGHNVTFTATISPNTATGTVQLQVNGTNFASRTLSDGTATFTTSSLHLGKNIVTVSYLGNANFNPSVSNSITITVTAQSSGGSQGTGTLSSDTNLGQLVSDFVHQRNMLKKEMRNQTVTIIHDCRTQVKSASPGDKKQIQEECKLKLQQIRQNFKNLQNQLKQQFEQLKAQFQSNIKQLHQDEDEEEKNMTKNFDNQISSLQGEIKQLHIQEGLEKKNMTENFNSQISFLQGKNNGDDSQDQKVNNSKGKPAKNGPNSPKGKGKHKED